MRMLRSSRNFRNRAEKSRSSCMTRVISSRLILSAVQALMTWLSPGAFPHGRQSFLAHKSPSPSSVMVASFPVAETTVTRARPF